MALDTYDRKLLSILQKSNKQAQRDLAETIGLSASAVNRRIAAMETNGVITGSITTVDPIKCGRPITIIVEVKMESERLNVLEEDKKRFVQCPYVQQVYYVTGDFDFLLVLNVRDMTEYERLTRELFFSSGNVKAFKTIVSMQNAKQTLSVATL